MKIGREINFQSWTFSDSFFLNVSPYAIVQWCNDASFCVHTLNLILFSSTLFITLSPETKIEIVPYFEQWNVCSCQMTSKDDVLCPFPNLHFWKGSITSQASSLATDHLLDGRPGIAARRQWADPNFVFFLAIVSWLFLSKVHYSLVIFSQ